MRIGVFDCLFTTQGNHLHQKPKARDTWSILLLLFVFVVGSRTCFGPLFLLVIRHIIESDQFSVFCFAVRSQGGGGHSSGDKLFLCLRLCHTGSNDWGGVFCGVEIRSSNLWPAMSWMSGSVRIITVTKNGKALTCRVNRGVSIFYLTFVHGSAGFSYTTKKFRKFPEPIAYAHHPYVSCICRSPLYLIGFDVCPNWSAHQTNHNDMGALHSSIPTQRLSRSWLTRCSRCAESVRSVDVRDSLQVVLLCWHDFLVSQILPLSDLTNWNRLFAANPNQCQFRGLLKEFFAADS